MLLTVVCKILLLPDVLRQQACGVLRHTREETVVMSISRCLACFAPKACRRYHTLLQVVRKSYLPTETSDRKTVMCAFTGEKSGEEMRWCSASL